MFLLLIFFLSLPSVFSSACPRFFLHLQCASRSFFNIQLKNAVKSYSWSELKRSAYSIRCHCTIMVMFMPCILKSRVRISA